MKKCCEDTARKTALDFFKRFQWNRYMPKKEMDLLKAKYLRGISEKEYLEASKKVFGEE